MAKLLFDPVAVRRVVEHALASPEHLPKPTGFDEIKGEIATEPDGPGVLLVHDQGVYLMSNGVPRDLVEGETSFAAYAKGCDPKQDGDWYETARALVGGDDFGEHLPWAQQIKAALDKGAKQVVVNLSPNKIELAFGGGRAVRIKAGNGSDSTEQKPKPKPKSKKTKRTLEDFQRDVAAKQAAPAEPDPTTQLGVLGPAPTSEPDDKLALPDFLDANKHADERKRSQAEWDEKRRAEASKQSSAPPKATTKKETDVADRRKIKTKPKAAARNKARAPSKNGDRQRYDWDAAMEAAERGVLPAAPDMTAETHRHHRGKLAELVKAAKAGDAKVLRAAIAELEKKKKLWQSDTLLHRYATTSLKALQSKSKGKKAA